MRWLRPEKLFVLWHSDAAAVVVGHEHLPMLQDLPVTLQLEIAGQPRQLALRHFWMTGHQGQGPFQPLEAALEWATTRLSCLHAEDRQARPARTPQVPVDRAQASLSPAFLS